MERQKRHTAHTQHTNEVNMSHTTSTTVNMGWETYREGKREATKTESRKQHRFTKKKTKNKSNQHKTKKTNQASIIGTKEYKQIVHPFPRETYAAATAGFLANCAPRVWLNTCLACSTKLFDDAGFKADVMLYTADCATGPCVLVAECRDRPLSTRNALDREAALN